MSGAVFRIKRLVTSEENEDAVLEQIKCSGLFIAGGRIAQAIFDLDSETPDVRSTEYMEISGAAIVSSTDTDLLDRIADASEDKGLSVSGASYSVLGFFSHVLRVGIDRPLTIYMIDSIIVSPLEFSEALELIAASA